MNDCIIETAGLTKLYGSQKSVSDLNIHVRRGGFTACWAATELGKPPP